jgi:hypothetical protein
MKASSPFGLLTVADQEQKISVRHTSDIGIPTEDRMKICRPQKKRASIQQAEGIDIMRNDRMSLKRQTPGIPEHTRKD